MTPQAVVVVHREAMVAEGISAALGRYPGIVTIGSTTNAPDAERLGARAHAVAIDPNVPDATRLARHLRRGGVRVVFLGNADGEDGTRVSTGAPVSALAGALAPAARARFGSSDPLTSREREVLQLAAKGLAGKQIAKELQISPKTVERHKTRIFAKLGVPNQAAAVFAYAERARGTNYGWR